MTEKLSRQTSMVWSQDICAWIAKKAGAENISAPAAVHGALSAAIVLARAIGMNDKAIFERVADILDNEFPEDTIIEDKALH